MNLKIKINHYFLLASVCAITVLAIDIASIYNLTLISVPWLRDLLVMTGIFFFFFAEKDVFQNVSIFNKVRLVFVFFFFIFIINHFSPVTGEFYGSLKNMTLGSLISIVSLMLFLFILILVRDLVFIQRTKSTSKNFTLLFLFFLLYSFLGDSSQLSLDFNAYSPGLGIFSDVKSNLHIFITFIMIFLIVINSFRTHWVKFLNKSEKIKTFFAGIICFLICIFYIDQLSSHIFQYSAVAEKLVSIVSMFFIIYISFSLLVILLHLPTAGVYDRKVKELSSLHHLSRNILGVFDLDRVMQIITEQTIAVAEANYCWLIIRNSNSGQFELVAQKDLPEAAVNYLSLNPDNELTTWVDKHKSALKIDRISKSPLTAKIHFLNYHSGSLLGIPLISNDKVMGILFAVKNIEYGFLADDKTLLTMFANNATIAIENAQLIKKSLEQEKYAQELKIAHEAQKKLLPLKMPKVETLDIDAACMTANEVGGDYYDFFEMKKSKLGVIIGDVSGKGAEAAFYMAEVKGIIESLSKIYISPKELLVEANKILHSNLDNKTFISMLYGIFDLKSKTFTFCRAGHCPLLYWDKKEKQVYLVEPPGLALGLDAGHHFEKVLVEEKISTQPGDIFILFTDGINEARNSRHEEFEEQRLCDVVIDVHDKTSTEIKQSIIDEVEKFIGKQPRHDDMTMVVIKRR